MAETSDNRPREGRPAAAPAVIVSGPTASGKSALALAIAESFQGTVINADALQVYRELAVLTARPGSEALARAPHRLYGTIPAVERCSAGRWRALALAALAEATEAGRLPVLAGGTGLYLRALEQGIAPVPPVPTALRLAAAERWSALGPDAFRAALVARDPASAVLHPNDRQRQLRAWEVLEATGRPLAHWQRESAPAGSAARPPYRFLRLVLLPERERLADAIDRRFAAMIGSGALEEVEALLALGLDPELPAMKAVGLRELAAHVRGETSLAEAVAAGQAATRRYAKRQLTWLRGQGLGSGAGQNAPVLAIPSQFSECSAQKIFSNVRRFLLTALQQEA